MVLKLIVAAIAAVLALVVLVRLIEPRFAFFPTTGESETPAASGIPFQSTTLTTADGERLRAWVFPQPAPKAVVLYFHGNGGNLSIWLPILAGIHRQGYEVYAIDYRGYGESTGGPTERGLYRDVDAAVEWVSRAAGRRAPLVYWGRSLGSTMAAYAATRRAPDGLILESGFGDARSLLRASPPLAFLGLFSTYRFPTAAFARQIHRPVLVMHGDRDSVIPFAAGRELFDAIAEPKEFVTIRDGDHNDLTPPDPIGYWRAVKEFVDRLRTAVARLPR